MGCDLMPKAARTFRPQARKQYPKRDLREGFRGRKRKDAKLRILIRDACTCQICGATVDMDNSILDHRTPLCRGGTNHDDNLQTLCEQCSKVKTARERAGQ